jgi:hypothetical protein
MDTQAAAGTPAALAGAATGWIERTRAIRWGLALLLTVGALAVFGFWLTEGKDLACQVVTTTTPGKPAQIIQTCGLPDISDFAYVLVVVIILLLPDTQKLKIGGVEFERLSSTVEQQTHEIRELRQTVNTTVNIGSDLVNQTRNGFAETKDILDRVRGFLPDTPEIRQQLDAMDLLESRIDGESWPDLFAGIMTMHGLIEVAARASAAKLITTSVAADTAENEAEAQEAEAVLSDYLGDTGPTADGH